MAGEALQKLPVVVAPIFFFWGGGGFKDGGWADEGGEGRRVLFLIPLNGRNVQAPFAKLCCAEL